MEIVLLLAVLVILILLFRNFSAVTDELASLKKELSDIKILLSKNVLLLVISFMYQRLKKIIIDDAKGL